jgi:hypothetical protein
MQLTIKGRTTKKVNKKLIKFAARWYGRHLFSSKIYRKMKLTIHIAPLSMDLFGECTYKNPKQCKYKYDIFINKKLSQKPLLITLAHEMVHAHQYASYQYVHYNRKTMHHLVKFNGKKYDINEVDYWDQPWEIDAAGREFGLYIRFINDMIEKGKI